MGTRLRLVVAGILVLLWSINAALAQQNDGSAQLGTTFPADFPVIKNYYLGVPVIGFGSNRGPHTHVPVIFLHGNNDTPFPTSCNQFFGHIHDFAQYFRDNGYGAGELWGLGYQGDQCDLLQDPTLRSGVAHSTAAAVPSLRAFVRAVLQYTGARHRMMHTVKSEHWLPSMDQITASLTARHLPSTFGNSRPAGALLPTAPYAMSMALTKRNFSPRSMLPAKQPGRRAISSFEMYSEHPPKAATSYISRRKTACFLGFRPKIAMATRTTSRPAHYCRELRQSTSSGRDNTIQSCKALT